MNILMNLMRIDMLNGIYNISDDYIDVEWNIEAEDQLKADIHS